ncbi:MAG: hypothetical protein ABFS03_13880, partial [Chloroflexota bacterium]
MNEDFKTKVIARDLSPHHSFLASFFAGLGEMGMLNQGSVNVVSRRAAEYLYSYLQAKDLCIDPADYADKPDLEALKYVMDHINEILSLLGSYELQITQDNQAMILIEASLCRICPKGVGGAEIKGTLCPIPSFFEKLVNFIMQEDKVSLITRGIEKEGTT